MTRSVSAGTFSRRPTHSVVMSAATVIGGTATSGSNPAFGARSARTRRKDGSASLPVTNRTRGGLVEGYPPAHLLNRREGQHLDGTAALRRLRVESQAGFLMPAADVADRQ